MACWAFNPLHVSIANAFVTKELSPNRSVYISISFSPNLSISLLQIRCLGIEPSRPEGNGATTHRNPRLPRSGRNQIVKYQRSLINPFYSLQPECLQRGKYLIKS